MPRGASVFTEAAKPRLSFPDTSTKPPLPPVSPPRARICEPVAAVVSLSDHTVTRPPSAWPRPLASVVLPPKRMVRSVEAMATSPPRPWSAPRASMVPICPTRSPSIVTWPGAAPRSAADTSMVPELTTAPATAPAGRIAPLAVATAVVSSPPMSRTTPPWFTSERAWMIPLLLTTLCRTSPAVLAVSSTRPPSAWMRPSLLTREESGLPSAPMD